MRTPSQDLHGVIKSEVALADRSPEPRPVARNVVGARACFGHGPGLEPRRTAA
jgi:hypothetical protein